MDAGTVLYKTLSVFSGFQFEVVDGLVNSASGGAAADAGIAPTTSLPSGTDSNNSMVIGFSFSGAVIPAGCGVLTNLELQDGAAGVAEIAISDPLGEPIHFVNFPEIIYGCMDQTACNYDETATAEEYGEIFTCIGDDPGVDYTTVVNETQCTNVNGVWWNDLNEDGVQQIDVGCDSVDPITCEYDFVADFGSVSCWYVAEGCTCDVDQGAYTDECGTCDSDPENDCVQDCSGAWGGSAVEDECGICDGDNSSCTQPIAYDSNILVDEDSEVSFTLDV
jgi:hypothetical protein